MDSGGAETAPTPVSERNHRYQVQRDLENSRGQPDTLLWRQTVRLRAARSMRRWTACRGPRSSTRGMCRDGDRSERVRDKLPSGGEQFTLTGSSRDGGAPPGRDAIESSRSGPSPVSKAEGRGR